MLCTLCCVHVREGTARAYPKQPAVESNKDEAVRQQRNKQQSHRLAQKLMGSSGITRERGCRDEAEGRGPAEHETLQLGEVLGLKKSINSEELTLKFTTE